MIGSRMARRGVLARNNTVFSPLDIPWDHLWWAEGSQMQAQAYADSAAVSLWPDEIGNWDPAGATNRPIWKNSSINGKPGVQFNGAVGLPAAAGSEVLAQPATWFAVIAPSSFSGDSDFVTRGRGTGTQRHTLRVNINDWVFYSGTNAPAGGTPTTAPHCVEGFFNDASSELRVDGVLTVSGTATGTQSQPGVSLGRDMLASARGFTGQMTFVGAIGRALTSTERANLTAWAIAYYGI